MNKLFAPALLLLASIIWGFAFPMQKMIEAVPPMAVIAIRSLIAVVVLFPLIFLFDRLQKNNRHFVSKRGLDFTRYELLGGTLIGLVYGVASAVQQMGLTEGTDAGKGAFISALYVVIVPVIGLCFGRKIRPLVWVAIALSVIGFYLLCLKGDFSMTPSDLLILLCALLFAIHILLVDHYAPKCDGLRVALIQFVSSTIMMSALSLIFEGPVEFSVVLSCFLPLVYLGVASSGVAYTLQIIGQKGTSPAVSSILLSLESVFGAVGAALLLGERMTLREGVGCAIVFLAVLLANSPSQRKTKKNI